MRRTYEEQNTKTVTNVYKHVRQLHTIENARQKDETTTQQHNANTPTKSNQYTHKHT